MKNISYLLLSVGLFFPILLIGDVPKVNLTGRADRVLRIEVRKNVLTAAEAYIKRGEDRAFLASIDEIENPWLFEPKSAVVVAPVVEEVEIVYDEASVLKVLGDSFAKQVRGTLAKGGLHYLQLQGGGLMKPGVSFPASVPEIAGQTFTVTVLEITSHGYVLQMGESTLPVSFSESSGATKDSAP